MKKTFRKVMASLLVAVMLLTAAPLAGIADINFSELFALKVNALLPSGSCGTNVTYTFDADTGLLTISGTGNMKDYYSYGSPFYYNSSIKSVVIEDGVTSIGDEAFYRCDGLTSITIPDSVTSIGSDAFCYCSSLTSVTIGNSVTSIESYAFCLCSSLTSITIPNSVTSIGNYAFSDCYSLTSVTIGNSVTSIGNHAFSSCYSLTSITIPAGVTSIGSEAFGHCPKRETITVDENNTVFDSRENCNAIIETSSNTLITGCKSTTIPDSVTSIGDYAFYDCESLTSITIPDSVTSIGSDAFSNCSSLTSVTIGNSVTSIGDYAFYYCEDLTSITIPDSVTSIGNDAFGYCESLTSITIPDSVTSIGNYAFYNCDSLTSITIHDSVTSIGSYAFADCTNLAEVALPNDIKSIGNNAFYNTPFWEAQSASDENAVYIGSCLVSVKNKSGVFVVRDGTKSIMGSAFSDCSEITGIVIPKSVIHIEQGVMELPGLESITVDQNNPVYDSRNNCNAIIETGSSTLIAGCKNTVIDEDIKNIGLAAFYGCEGLTEIVIPDSVISIGYGAFEECYNLTNVTLGSSVESIGARAFAECESLTDIVIPDSVISIGYGAFEECYNLTNVTLGSSVESIGMEVFGECISLKSITIPESTAYIGSETFNDCESLSEINLPDTVELVSVEWYCFYDSAYWNNPDNWEDGVLYIGNHLIKADESLSGSYTVKPGTVEICGGAFDGCENLTEVIIPDSVNKIGMYAFEDTAVWDNPDNWENGALYIGDNLIAVDGSVTGAYHVKPGTKTIASGAFAESGITDLFIPESVKGIGCAGIFSENLQSVSVDADNPYYDSRNGCNFVIDSRTNLLVGGCGTVVPKGIRGIEIYGTFSSNREIYIPDSVKYIDLCFGEFNDIYFEGTEEQWLTYDAALEAYGGDAMHYNCTMPAAEEGIRIASQPDKKAYKVNEEFNSAGMVVMGCFDGVDTEITDYTLNYDFSNPGNTFVRVSANHNGKKYMAYVPVTVAKTLSGYTVDGNTIIGLNAGITVSEFITNNHFDNGVTVSVNPSEGNIGTGSKVTLTYSDGTSVEYNVVIFGDVNGDGIYDGTDSIIVNCLANGLLSKEQVGEAVYMAADCNHDDVIDKADVALLEQAGIILASVDQTKTEAELMTDAAYVEYLSLIDQSPAEEIVVDTTGNSTSENEAGKAETSTEKTDTSSTDKSEEKPVNETVSKSFIQRVIDFIIYIVNLMKSFIVKT